MTLLNAVLIATTAWSAPKGPKFAWDTLPVFFHSSNSSGPWNDEAIQIMARFPMVTIEKFQGPCGNSHNTSPACHQEKLIIAELRRVKAVNPNVSAVFYYNSVLDFPQYSVHAQMLADPSLMLHDAKGDVVHMGCPSPVGKCDVFDFSNPRARALFIEICVNATKTGVVDGCFADRAVDGTPTDSKHGDMFPCKGADCRYKLGLSNETAQAYFDGHVKVLADLQAAIGEGPLIANHAFGPPHDALTAATKVSFSMIEGFGPNNQSISQLLMAASNNRGVQAHGHGVSEDILAAFLVGAGYRAYYGMGGWSGHSATDHWSDVFTYPLGDPLGDGVLSEQGVWSRSFEHVNVTFDIHSNKGKIEGWQFTPPSPSPPTPPAPSPTGSCPKIGIACGYSHFDLGITKAHSWSECCAACHARPNCTKWVLRRTEGSNCRLHSEEAKMSEDNADSLYCGEIEK